MKGRYIFVLVLGLIVLLEGRMLLALIWQNIGYVELVKGNMQSSRYLAKAEIAFLKSKSLLMHQQVGTLKGLGYLYIYDHQVVKAMKYLESAYQLDPSNQILMYFLGSVYWENGLRDKALYLWQEAGVGNYFALQGKQLANDGNNMAAIEKLRFAIRIDPINAQAHFELGKLLITSGDLEQALDEFKTTVKYSPNMTDGYLWLGNCYTYLNQPENALKAYLRARALAPSSQIVDMCIGRTYYYLGNLVEAESYLKSFLKDNPLHADAHALLGQVYVYQGQWAVAETHLMQAITLLPDNAQYHVLLSQVYLNQGKESKAREQLVDGYCLTPADWLRTQIEVQMKTMGVTPPICKR
jgi:tetratricopeptide (TPR) repeat protein